jgi:hypothetical protein
MQTLLNRLLIQGLSARSTLTGLATAGAIGLAFVLWLFPLSFLAGTSPFWDFPHGVVAGSDADFATVMIGDTYYAHAHGPTLAAQNLDYPAGTNVAMLDGVPLVALAQRAVFALTGIVPNLLALWIGFCFVANAVSFAWLLTTLRVKGLVPIAAGSAIAVQMPALLYRFGHVAHIAWFFFLAALALYFLSRQRRRAFFAAMAAVLGLALLTNSYIFLTSAAILATTLVALWRDGALTLRGMMLRLAGLLALTLAVMSLTQHLAYAGIPRLGYTYYSLNLLGPFVPQWSDLLGLREPLLAVGGQYEGYNYLGAGVLALILGAIGFGAAATRGQSLIATLRPPLRRHRWLVVLCLALTLLAVTYRVTIGPLDIFKDALDHQAATRFLELNVFSAIRASGRLFWPVACLIAAASVAVWCRTTRPAIAAAGLIAAALLQTADTKTLRTAVRHEAATVLPWMLMRDTWNPLLARHDAVAVYPSFTCHSGGRSWIKASLELGVLASRLDRPISNVVFPGATRHDCGQERARFRRLPFDGRTLYVFFDGLPPAWPASDCAHTAYFTVCTRRWGDLRGRPLANPPLPARSCILAGTPYCGAPH